MDITRTPRGGPKKPYGRRGRRVWLNKFKNI
jgi:hypothetical protein